ncbi:MAG TPA: hypothetical protein VGK67_14850 [Myxococcales bacterium]|jgi:hypothetical protein
MRAARLIAQLLLLAAGPVVFGVGCTGEVLLADECYADPSGEACSPADPCAAIDCGAHGRCAVGTAGAASCECDFGFEPVGGSCQAVDPCEAIDCGSQGTCIATSGQAACQCASGFETSGLSCVAVDPCKSVDCGVHGTCSVVSGAAACACDSGFEPSGLSCVPVDPCKAIACGVGAHCAAGTCACDAGQSGDPQVECKAPTSRELQVRQKLVDIAHAELGMCEGTNQRPYMERQPGLWCYDFVEWVHTSANEGLGQPLYLPRRDPQSLPGWRPKAGDLIKYTYQHYAMVKAVDGDLVYTVEGNVNGCVMERATSYADVEYYGTLEASFP